MKRERQRRGRFPGRHRIAMVALCLVVALSAAVPAFAQEVGAAARVNGAEISLFRLERHFEDYLKQQARNVGAIRNPDVFTRLKREALDQLIDKELLWQEAQRRGVTVPDEDVRAARKAVASGFTTPEAFQRRLADAGFDDASYDAYLRRELAASKTLMEIAGDVSVSDDEVTRTLEREPAPDGMSDEIARRQVREHLLALRRAAAGRDAIARLRGEARIELRDGF